MATMSLREKISRAADAFVDIKVQNLPLQFYMSTLDGLADLFEDEIIPTPVPMKVKHIIHLLCLLKYNLTIEYNHTLDKLICFVPS